MKAVGRKSGFTLIELLVVISILGALAAIMAPAIKNFGRADAAAAASRQLLDAVGQARQLAISQRTPVYMVFVPADLLALPGYNAWYSALSLTPAEQDKANRLFDKQLNSYALVALRSVGDQPGRSHPRYLSSWKSLPEGTFIARWKFGPRNLSVIVTNHGSEQGFNVNGFNVTNIIPFPSEDAPASAYNNLFLPYIAFDYNGQVTSGVDEFVPLARGTIAHALDPVTKNPRAAPPSVSENPPDNSTTNGFNVVHIDWLTGRARVERPQIQ